MAKYWPYAITKHPDAMAVAAPNGVVIAKVAPLTDHHSHLLGKWLAAYTRRLLPGAEVHLLVDHERRGNIPEITSAWVPEAPTYPIETLIAVLRLKWELLAGIGR